MIAGIIIVVALAQFLGCVLFAALDRQRTKHLVKALELHQGLIAGLNARVASLEAAANEQKILPLVFRPEAQTQRKRRDQNGRFSS